MRSFDCKRYVFVILLVLVTGCSGDRTFEDLDEFMATTRARPGGKIPPMPVLQVHEVFKYGAMRLRSPFDPPTTVVADRNSGKAAVKPDGSRPKEVLESKNFASLGMVGSLLRNGVRSTLISDGEEIHRVSLGDYLGKNHGQVIEINEKRTDVVEIIPDGDGGWVERPRTLPLKEKENR